MNSDLIEFDHQLQRVVNGLSKLLRELVTWPHAIECFKPDSYEMDAQLLAARKPFDVSEKLDDLQQQAEQLQGRPELLEAFECDTPMPWLAEYGSSIDLHESSPAKQLFNELLCEKAGSLHAALIELSTRCLRDLRLSQSLGEKCAQAEHWREVLGVVSNGTFWLQRLRCEVVRAELTVETSPGDGQAEQPAAISADDISHSGSLDARALQIFVDNTTLQKVDIAKLLDIKPQNLSPKRCPKFHALWQANRGSAPPRGTKYNQTEAWTDDE